MRSDDRYENKAYFILVNNRKTFIIKSFLSFLQIAKSMNSKFIVNDTHWSFNPNAPCFNYIFCHHIGEIFIIPQQHYDGFPSVTNVTY